MEGCFKQGEQHVQEPRGSRTRSLSVELQQFCFLEAESGRRLSLSSVGPLLTTVLPGAEENQDSEERNHLIPRQQTALPISSQSFLIKDADTVYSSTRDTGPVWSESTGLTTTKTKCYEQPRSLPSAIQTPSTSNTCIRKTERLAAVCD